MKSTNKTYKICTARSNNHSEPTQECIVPNGIKMSRRLNEIPLDESRLCIFPKI